MRRGIVVALVLGLVGCAGVHVTPGDSGKGIRYYRSAPYLLAYTDNNGGIKTELVYLPDTHQVFAAYPYSIFATANTTFDFEGGLLRTGEAEVDTGVIPRAVVSALEKIATASIAAALREPATGKPNVVPAPRLFRVVWDGGTAYLVGPNGPICAGTTTDINVKGKPAPLQPCTHPPPPCVPPPCIQSAAPVPTATNSAGGAL